MTSRPAASETQPAGSSAGTFAVASVFRDSELQESEFQESVFNAITVARPADDPSLYSTGVSMVPVAAGLTLSTVWAVSPVRGRAAQAGWFTGGPGQQHGGQGLAVGGLQLFSSDTAMNRRQLLIGSAIGAAGAALPLFRPDRARASGAMSHELLENLQVCTPRDALTRLQEGNARFARAWASASGKASPEQRMEILNGIWEKNCQIDPVALA